MTIPTDQSPSDQPPIVGIESVSREDLKRVARYQKWIIFCILYQLISVFVLLAGALGQSTFVVAIGWYLSLFGGLILLVPLTFFVFLLAIKVFSTGIGILLGLLWLVPYFGLLVLLFINVRATRVLRENGIRVGLFGAKRFAN